VCECVATGARREPTRDVKEKESKADGRKGTIVQNRREKTERVHKRRDKRENSTIHGKNENESKTGGRIKKTV
jgi:hypothetical protein